MGTRANIVIKDSVSEKIFYRHYDGYPKVVNVDLDKILTFISTGNIKNTVDNISNILLFVGFEILKYGSKYGHYEPTTEIHGDISYLYILDIEKQTISCKKQY